MKRKKEKIKTTHINLALFFLILAVGFNQFLIYKIENNLSFLTPTNDISKDLKSGATSDYGISLDNQGYQKLLEYENSITLTKEQNSQIVGLDINMSCCGVQKILPAGNCACGHHLALHGLAKYLVTNGFDRNQIQNEINKWKEVFYPESGNGNMGGC